MSRIVLHVLLPFLFFGSFVHAETPCEQLLQAPEGLISSSYLQKEVGQFLRLAPDVQAKLGASNVAAVFADAENPLTRQKLAEVLNSLNPSSTVADLEQALRSRLELRVPEHQIESRLANLQDGDPASLRRALGYKTLAETQELVHDLLGRYLAETQAAHLERQYPNGPTPQEGLGAAKLTVALSPQRRDLFLKYFNFPELMMHYHTTNQGTLLIFFNGQKISYAGSSLSPLDDGSFTQAGMLVPFILLSSSEANRMANYVQLARLNQNMAKLPWTLPGYCAAGGYNSCTHWFGEMPIGDVLIDEYSFPGRVDQYATNPYVPAENQGPQTAPLRPYWDNPAYQNLLNGLLAQLSFVQLPNLDPALLDDAGNLSTERYRLLLDRLTRVVWTVPGHLPMGDNLGERDAKNRGELANPGYVVNVLTGRISSSRVPVVFYTQPDDQILDPNFPLNIHAY